MFLIKCIASIMYSLTYKNAFLKQNLYNLLADLFTSLPILVLGGRYQSSHEIPYTSIYTIIPRKVKRLN